jgi:hypothetical protein
MLLFRRYAKIVIELEWGFRIIYCHLIILAVLSRSAKSVRCTANNMELTEKPPERAAFLL